MRTNRGDPYYGILSTGINIYLLYIYLPQNKEKVSGKRTSKTPNMNVVPSLKLVTGRVICPLHKKRTRVSFKILLILNFYSRHIRES